MARVFLYESLTGGGCWAAGIRPTGSLLVEGRAMRDALAEDLARGGHRLILTLDARLVGGSTPLCGLIGGAVQLVSPGELAAGQTSAAVALIVDDAATERAAFMAACRSADAAWLIAPEIGGALARRARWATEAGCPLLSPAVELVALASDKWAAQRWFRRAGFTVPWPIVDLALPAGPAGDQPLPPGLAFPVVCKPRDGAGSMGVRVCRSPEELVRYTRAASRSAKLFCEPLVRGAAVSVGVVGDGRGGCQVLPPCRQVLSEEGEFRYLGGEVLPPGPLAERAGAVAGRVGRALAPFCGYLGLDLVLDDGGVDYIVELNPRLTTSYLGLRAVAGGNLADWILRYARDGGCPPPAFASGPLRFTPRGVG